MKKLFLILFVLMLSSCGYNQLQSLDEDVKAAMSEVQSQYQRRHDLIPNLVESVKGFATQEKETLQAVVEARAKATQTTLNVDSLSDPNMVKKFQEAQGALSQALSRLLVVAEKYPDLKSNEHFKELMVQLEGTENRIGVARKRYIDSVANYNKAVRSFPFNLTAKFLLGLNVREPFTVSEEAMQVPKVDFNKK